MADIDELDEFGKQEILRRMKLEVSRMQMQIEENEFKLFMMEKERVKLTESIEHSREAIKEKKAELAKHQQEFGVK